MLKLNEPEYCNADRTTGKLTLQDINTTPKELKTESGIVAIDSCFAFIAALQYDVTTRESSVEKYPRTVIYVT